MGRGRLSDYRCIRCGRLTTLVEAMTRKVNTGRCAECGSAIIRVLGKRGKQSEDPSNGEASS